MGEARGSSDERGATRWQERLLPFLVVAISLMAVFFFISSLLQLQRLGETVAFHPSDNVETFLQSYEREQRNADETQGLDYVQWKTLVLLERETVAHRYSQVNAALMLRAWTRYLGFLTGMILALVGAIFILAKMSEAETKLSGEGVWGKGALATGSPGIVLAVLGTVLMLVTLSANFEFNTRDVPVYLRPEISAQEAIPPAAPLDSEEARRKEQDALFPPAKEPTHATDQESPKP